MAEIFDSISENVENFIVTFLTNDLWRILLAALIIAVALLLKSFISKVVLRLIEKRLVGKGRVERITDAVIEIIDRPVRLLVVTLGIYLCQSVLRLPDSFRSVVYKAVTSLTLYAIFWLLYNASSYLKTALMSLSERSRTHLDNIAANYLVYTLRVVVILLGALSILQIWIGNITSILAGLSIGGVAFALAAQDTAANLLGSITVMLDHPFEIGEYIEIGSSAGTVEKMGLRSTRIRTLDQSLIIIPNKTMSSSNIINWSKLDRRRVSFTLGIVHTATPAQLQAVISRIIAMLCARDDVRDDGMIVNFAGFGAGSLDIAISFTTQTAGAVEAGNVRERINYEIMAILGELGLSLALPTQSVYVAPRTVNLPPIDTAATDHKGMN